MLIVDEVHHLLAGSHREQRASLNLLKYLANDLKISVVAVGTSDAPVAFQSDAQMSSRFTLFEIPRWTESDDFRRLLRAFEQALPLRRPSDLVQRPIVQFLVSASGGLLGKVSRLLNQAAEQAIQDHSERISLQHLEHLPSKPHLVACSNAVNSVARSLFAGRKHLGQVAILKPFVAPIAASQVLKAVDQPY